MLDKQLQATQNPHSDIVYQYGPSMLPCYSGEPSEYTMQQNNVDWLQRILLSMTGHMLAAAHQKCGNQVLALLKTFRPAARTVQKTSRHIPFSGTLSSHE
jgi:hypothetical protein